MSPAVWCRGNCIQRAGGEAWAIIQGLPLTDDLRRVPFLPGPQSHSLQNELMGLYYLRYLPNPILRLDPSLFESCQCPLPQPGQAGHYSRGSLGPGGDTPRLESSLPHLLTVTLCSLLLQFVPGPSSISSDSKTHLRQCRGIKGDTWHRCLKLPGRGLGHRPQCTAVFSGFKPHVPSCHLVILILQLQLELCLLQEALLACS